MWKSAGGLSEDRVKVVLSQGQHDILYMCTDFAEFVNRPLTGQSSADSSMATITKRIGARFRALSRLVVTG
jgi:hypothetical protein